MGGGYRFNKHLSLLAEYTFNHFDIPETVVTDVSQGVDVSNIAAGHVHLWSITLIPTYDIFQRESFAAYVLGGGGLYRKYMLFQASPCSFTCTPDGSEASPFSDAGRYTNNAGGIEGGLGISQALTQERTIKLFAEVRYVWVDNPTAGPASSGEVRTSYLPITAGIRW